MKPILETSRLVLREFDIVDAKHMYELNTDPQVLRYTGDVPFSSIKEATHFLQNYSDYRKNGYGRWAVIRKDDNKFIGWCGLKLNEEGFTDIGFRFFKSEWNRGYAIESAKATLSYGFNTLKLKEIIGRASADNKPSIRVLEKLNMTFWKFDECEGVKNAVYYKIHTTQFKN